MSTSASFTCHNPPCRFDPKNPPEHGDELPAHLSSGGGGGASSSASPSPSLVFLTCARCGRAWYCSVKCLNAHSSDHARDCRPAAEVAAELQLCAAERADTLAADLPRQQFAVGQRRCWVDMVGLREGTHVDVRTCDVPYEDVWLRILQSGGQEAESLNLGSYPAALAFSRQLCRVYRDTPQAGEVGVEEFGQAMHCWALLHSHVYCVPLHELCVETWSKYVRAQVRWCAFLLGWTDPDEDTSWIKLDYADYVEYGRRLRDGEREHYVVEEEEEDGDNAESCTFDPFAAGDDVVAEKLVILDVEAKCMAVYYELTQGRKRLALTLTEKLRLQVLDDDDAATVGGTTSKHALFVVSCASIYRDFHFLPEALALMGLLRDEVANNVHVRAVALRAQIQDYLLRREFEHSRVDATPEAAERAQANIDLLFDCLEEQEPLMGDLFPLMRFAHMSLRVLFECNGGSRDGVHAVPDVDGDGVHVEGTPVAALSGVGWFTYPYVPAYTRSLRLLATRCGIDCMRAIDMSTDHSFCGYHSHVGLLSRLLQDIKYEPKILFVPQVSIALAMQIDDIVFRVHDRDRMPDWSVLSCGLAHSFRFARTVDARLVGSLVWLRAMKIDQPGTGSRPEMLRRMHRESFNALRGYAKNLNKPHRLYNVLGYLKAAQATVLQDLYLYDERCAPAVRAVDMYVRAGKCTTWGNLNVRERHLFTETITEAAGVLMCAKESKHFPKLIRELEKLIHDGCVCSSNCSTMHTAWLFLVMMKEGLGQPYLDDALSLLDVAQEGGDTEMEGMAYEHLALHYMSQGELILASAYAHEAVAAGRTLTRTELQQLLESADAASPGPPKSNKAKDKKKKKKKKKKKGKRG